MSMVRTKTNTRWVSHVEQIMVRIKTNSSRVNHAEPQSR